MPTKYEYYDTETGGSATYTAIFGVDWNAQTFTPSITHFINYVLFKGYRTGSPGTITVSIRATDGSSLPTGADLASGTFDGNTLKSGLANIDWFTVDLTSAYPLVASTKYAIVIRAPTADGVTNYFQIKTYNTGYAGGANCYSGDSGVSWVENPNDFLFEEWGSLVPGESAGIIAVVETRLHYVDAYGVERFLLGSPVV